MNLRELSDILGLSQTTVSRALNGFPEVKEETRRRVREAAEKHGYSPDTRARSLATGRAMSIGHVIPVSSQHQMANVVFADFIAGAGEVYGNLGYDMLISFVTDDEQEQTYRNLVRKRSVDGVIVHGPVRDDFRIPLLQELDLPFLVHGRSSDVISSYSWLDVDNVQALRRATAYLIDQGHRRIALLNGPEHMDFAWRRRTGYLNALHEVDITEDPYLMRDGEMTEPFGYSSTVEMLRSDNPPSAILTSSIVIALGVRRAIEECGRTIGKDISVICFDDRISYLPNGTEEPIFTAVRSSVSDAGKRCAELLIEQINTPGTPAAQELWRADLILGQSTGPALQKV